MAFSSIASNTAARLPGDKLMTCNTSVVAVWRSSDFSEIIGALTQFVEQPRILDGDDGLSGEVPDQFDLLVGEGTDFLAGQGKGPDQLVVFQHRDG